MKRIIQPLSFILMTALALSCTTTLKMQRTYPPEADLPADSNRFVFVNFFDYQVPDFIKDRNEPAYGAAVKGFSAGLAELIMKDPRAFYMVADTLRKGFTVMSMQDPEFTDTVRTICSQLGANLLIALDSINLWVESEIMLAEDDEGDAVLAKDFYLFANTYITLYTSEGEVVDRCAGEKSTYVKTKYTIFGLIGGPTLANRKEHISLLAKEAAKDCIGKFYPFTENYTEMLYTGGPLKQPANSIVAGRPEEALEPLRQFSASPDPALARKASHNLRIVNDLIENRRASDEIWKVFRNEGLAGN